MLFIDHLLLLLVLFIS